MLKSLFKKFSGKFRNREAEAPLPIVNSEQVLIAASNSVWLKSLPDIAQSDFLGIIKSKLSTDENLNSDRIKQSIDNASSYVCRELQMSLSVVGDVRNEISKEIFQVAYGITEKER